MSRSKAVVFKPLVAPTDLLAARKVMQSEDQELVPNTQKELPLFQPKMSPESVFHQVFHYLEIRQSVHRKERIELLNTQNFT